MQRMGTAVAIKSKKVLRHSYRLGSVPSFWTGVARVLDLGATFDCYNVSETDSQADIDSFMLDMKTLRNDYQIAMAKAKTSNG